MRIGGRKLSELLPGPLSGLAKRAGLEQSRLRLALRDAELTLRRHLGNAIRHLHGPPRPPVGPEELVVVAMMRNAEVWLPTYLRHHRELGAEHFVVLDNGSTDATLDLLLGREEITVYGTDLPYSRFWPVLKRWLVKRFAGRGWVLIADADELFDYPFSRRLPLSGFLRYLNRNGYSAVSVHNLEMFSGEPLRAVQGREEPDLRPAYPYYDISDITEERDRYWLDMNEFDSPGHCMHSGGVRQRVFGWTGSMLTKHSLLRPAAGVDVFRYDDHFVTGARIADVTALFRHYKFIGHFYEHMMEEIGREEHYDGARIFKRYAEVWRREPDLRLAGPDASAYTTAESLLDSGFLMASRDYREWVERHGAAR